MDAEKVESILADYDKDDISIATIGSHSALNIFKGAQEEGFKTVCLCKKGREKTYNHFGVADEFIYLDSYSDILKEKVQDKLKQLNSIVIPHGSFNAYVDADQLQHGFDVPTFGNRSLLEWEVGRAKQHQWLKNAEIDVPKVYDDIKDVDGLAFIKFEGAKGGKGYFVADSEETFTEKLNDMRSRNLINTEEAENPYIQEYITGVSVYPHFFHSPLKNKTELIGFDKRYESSVDGIFRIPVPEQLGQKINPSFSVVGNFPMVVRESLLNKYLKMGDKITKAAQDMAPPGTIGPFCLETIVTDDLDIVAFEISARIVAGCNANMGWNPYTYLQYDEPMYMGRRIAVEVKDALQQDALEETVT